MNQDIIVRLAKSCTTNKISKDTASFVLNKLTNKDLKLFARHLRAELDKTRIYVTTSSILSIPLRKELEGAFNGKEIIEITDNSVGAGIKIQENDSIIDFTFKRYINDVIDKIKE